MSLLDRVDDERRAITVPWQPWNNPNLPYSSGGPAHPSRTVLGTEGSLTLSPLFSAVRLLSDMVAGLPLNQYRKDGDRTVKMESGQLLSHPASYGTIYDWVFQGTASMLCHGNAIGLIVSRDGYGFPTAVEWLPADQVEEQPDETQPWNVGRSQLIFGGMTLPKDQIFHVRAFTLPGRLLGLSPLRLFMSLIGHGQDANEYGSTWFKSGGFPPGTFQNQEIEVEADDADEIKRRLTRAIQAREPLVYGKDWEYKPISVPPKEAQFLEAMQMNATQIAAIYGVPPEKVGGKRGDPLTYSTQETETLSLIQNTLHPWLVRWETALFDCLPEKQFARFNTRAMLKTTTETRFDIYAKSRAMGLQTIDQIRELEEMEPIGTLLGTETIPGDVLSAMARGITETPISMASLTQISDTHKAQFASNEKVASIKAEPPLIAAEATADAVKNPPPQPPPGQPPPGQPPGQQTPPNQAKAAARSGWRGDYELDPAEIRRIMANGSK